MELTKFKIDIPDKKGYWVELHSASLMNESMMIHVDNWVRNNKLGKRMAFNMWKLKNEQSRNWFILKWS
jgi:hypothetical protein